MKTILIASCLALASLGATAADSAAAPKKPLSAQQQRMKDCNAQAKTQGLKGAPRKTFMSGCLKGEASPGHEAKPAAAAKKPA